MGCGSSVKTSPEAENSKDGAPASESLADKAADVAASAAASAKDAASTAGKAAASAAGKAADAAKGAGTAAKDAAKDAVEKAADAAKDVVAGIGRIGGNLRRDGTEHAGRVERRAKGPDWNSADKSRWLFPEVRVSGSYSFHSDPQIEKVTAVISKGLEDLKANPQSSDGLFFQSSMIDWPEEQQKYSIVKRAGSGFHMTPDPGGGFTWVQAKYQALPPDVSVDPDEYTDSMSYGGHTLGEPRMPGRGQGCCDIPGLRLIGLEHPRDVSQGRVGDCWLLCAMSAVAEYKGVVQKLFKNTSELNKRPLDTFNKYTVTLYDLSSPEWKPVDIIVDERLCSKPDNSSVIGAHPSITGELWACYLEKAVAAHTGGWDEINGGTCTHAWRLLLGCKHVFTFNKKDDGFGCFGTFNPNTNEWEQLDNSPQKGFQGLWPMAWPEVGGGGDLDLRLSNDDFFDRLVTWDDQDYIMACGSEAGSDKIQKEGIVQGHAYTLLECVSNPGGVQVDLVKVRNPWGKGEFTAGKWTDEGSGWKEHPKVKDTLHPEDADDGAFWMEKDELFQYFPTFYLCAMDMSKLQ